MAKPKPHRQHLYKAASFQRLRTRFTANLLRVRSEMKLTQQEAAERCEMQMQQFQQLEAGEANATLRTIARVAEGLGIDVSELFRPTR